MLKNNFIKNLIILISFVMLFASCKEDTVEPIYFGNISGSVMDADDGTPIQGVSITTTPPTSSIITDAQGKFNLSELTAETYTISASKNGYNKTTTNVSVEGNKTTEAVIILSKRDDTAAPPLPPVNPLPEDGMVDQNTSLTLTWSVSDQNESDSLLYDVFIYDAGQINSLKIGDNVGDTTLFVENLDFNSVYYWQIVVKDGINSEVNGEVWSFKTKSLPNNPYVYTSDSTGNYEIYTTDGTTENLVRLTNNSVRDWYPRFNPIRDVIAFTSDRTASYQIFKMNADGSDLFQVTQVPIAGNHNSGIGFSWSPDGSSLLYSHYDKLYKIGSDGSNLTQIATAPATRHFRETNWSSTGDKIVVLTIGNSFYNSEIYTMNSDGSEMAMIVDNKPGAMTSPSFSLDGKFIMYTQDASGYQDATSRQLDARIYLYDLDSLNSTDLSTHKPNGTNDLNPQFSSDGSKIIFENVNNNSGSSSIWTMDINGDNRTKIITTGKMPDWK